MTPKEKRADLVTFHQAMWAKFRENANGKTGPQVVDALAAASEKVYDAGIDHAYQPKLDDTVALAFDLTWLTAVNIELTAGK